MTINFFWLLILKVHVRRVKKIYIPYFICGQKSTIKDKKYWLSKVSEIGWVTMHFLANVMLIKNRIRTQDQNELFGKFKMQKVVTIIIKERLPSRKSCKKYPIRVVLFFPWRELTSSRWLRCYWFKRYSAMSCSVIVSLHHKLEYSVR